MTKRYLATAHPIPYADAAALQDAFSTHYPEQSLQDGPEYSLDTRTQQISDTKSQIFLFHAVMVYGAVVLMVICFTILSLQPAVGRQPVPLPVRCAAQAGRGGPLHPPSHFQTAGSVVWVACGSWPF